MMMEINLKLPDEWQAFIEAEATAGGHATAADYVHMLVMQARLERSRAQVEALVEQGIQSGPAVEWTDEDWDEIWQKIEVSQAQKNGNTP